MSINILSSPINHAPVYSPLIYTVNAPTLLGEDNFRYICQIKDGANVIITLKSFPHPQFGYGRFDINRIINSLLSEAVDFDSGVFSASEITKQLTAEFGWSYTDGNYVEVLNNQSDTKTYFNGAPTYQEYNDIIEANPQHPYVITSGDGYEKYPLTSRRTIETLDNTRQWVYYISSIWQNIRYLDVRNDSNQAIQRIDLPSSLRNNTDGKVVAFRADKGFIEANTSFTELQKWSVRTSDASTNPTSRFISFRLLECQKWSPYHLYYLNRFGGMDSLGFSGKSQRYERSEQKRYQTDPINIGADGTVNYTTTNHSRKAYWTEASQRYILNSAWINYTTQLHIQDLQSSPLVWMENETGDILPVQINQETFEVEDDATTDVKSVRMEVEYIEPTKRQQV